MAFLEIRNLGKRFSAAGPSIFDGVNFDVERGEFVCIIGHSGCGKTTILNILAGLDSASDGVVVMDGREVAGPSLDRGVVFQNHALMPWQSAAGNIAFAVKSRWPEWSRHQVREHVGKFVELVGLAESEHKKPAQLSGGMKQRVGIARAFAIAPKMLLLDEPFGALDALTRGIIQEELLRICAASKQTVFMVTHDVDEAILLSDRVLLMSNGPQAYIAEIVEVGLPRPRDRHTIHHARDYYAIRNHLVDFLVNRSKVYQSEAQRPKAPHIVHPRHRDDASLVDVPAAVAAATV